MSTRLFSDGFLRHTGNDFMARRLAEDVVLAEVGADAVADLLSWADLSEILSTRPLEPPRIRLHRKGSAVPVADYTTPATIAGTEVALVRPEALYRELRGGASLILDAVDRIHPPIREAADDLMRMVRERVQVNLYLLWGATHGFDTHWDDHDTFIVQIYGTKAWTVHGPGRPHPMKTDTDHGHTAPESVMWEGVLKPGQILHVPRGWWHNVRGTGDVSLHLTFGFTRATGIDWVNWLIEQLYADDAFRQDLPRFGSATEQQAHQKRLAERVASLASSADLTEFFASRDGHFPQRHRFSLPWPVEFGMLTPQTRIEFTPLLAPTVTRDDAAVALETGGKRYRFAAAAGPVLDALIAGPSTTVDDLQARSGAGSDVVQAVLEALARENLVLLR